MTPLASPLPRAAQPSDTDLFARRITAQLDQASAELPYDITERLRAARMQALDQRKKPAVQARLHQASSTTALGHGPTLTLGGHGGGGGEGRWWHAVGAAVPLLALAVGLLMVGVAQNQTAASEIAEIDAALLLDDLPPAAYTDPGFLQYLKTPRATSLPTP